MKKRIISLVISVLIVMSMGCSVFASPASDARNAVVVVRSVFELSDGDEMPWGQGSGFFIKDPDSTKPTYLITNYHVISDFVILGKGQMGKYKIWEYLYSNDYISKKDAEYLIALLGETLQGRSKIRVYYSSEDYEEAYLVDYDEVKDIAILRINEPTDKRSGLELLVPEEDMIGETVQAIGYPGLADNLYRESTSKQTPTDATVTTGSINRFITEAGNGTEQIQIDCDIKHGNSGGPLVYNGAAIGINTSFIQSDADKINYAVNIVEITRKLEQLDIKFVAAKLDDDDSMRWIALGILAVIIIACVIFAVSRKNAGNKKEDTEEKPVKKRTPIVRSLSSQHSDLRVSLAEGRIVTVGREPDCTIVFRKDTPGVSGRHCSLRYDEQSECFLLTDLRSTYGTYLQHKQRIEANKPVRLRAGDQFYLGEETNVLRVEWE